MFKERLNKALDFKRISAYQLSKETGIPQGTISNYRNKSVKPSASIVKQIASALEISYEWLLTGKGEMLRKNTIGININQGDGNIIGQGNHNNIKTGNVVNVALPDAGTQKIIKPDGEIEVITTESNISMLDTLKRENENLKAEVMYLKNTITTKNDLIDSLRETIDILKNK
ncbi:helix-turn-helix family protein [Bacteroides fragilis str. S23 R14]|uniref:helix-turn-helix domain-containing protein n=1 Tax=Bacteroides fragilis TaxID=817 RepID=UPI0004487940|nr:helix-turn-helix transcriptional regulator [Bacteroides fragilis]EYA00198.1 helix-turn-helix family protein [Bacteroides fragilis str. S23 R14]